MQQGPGCVLRQRGRPPPAVTGTLKSECCPWARPCADGGTRLHKRTESRVSTGGTGVLLASATGLWRCESRTPRNQPVFPRLIDTNKDIASYSIFLVTKYHQTSK